MDVCAQSSRRFTFYILQRLLRNDQWELFDTGCNMTSTKTSLPEEDEIRKLCVIASFMFRVLRGVSDIWLIGRLFITIVTMQLFKA